MAGQQDGWAVPRQTGALPAAAGAAPAVIGVSAFAFQGTNAHALLAAPEQAGSSLQKPAAHWAQQRFWVAPRPHAGKAGGIKESLAALTASGMGLIALARPTCVSATARGVI